MNDGVYRGSLDALAVVLAEHDAVVGRLKSLSLHRYSYR